MDTAQYFPFLRMVSAVLAGQPAPLPTTPEGWKQLYLMTQRNHMPGFLYIAVNERTEVPPRLFSRIREDYFRSLNQQLLQASALKELFGQLRANGIRYLPLKGEVLRCLYPRPDLRFSCDIDFLYEKKYTSRVRKILVSLGYRLYGTVPHHDEYMRGVVTVEPHRYLNLHTCAIDSYYEDIWTRLVTDDGIEYRFTDEDFYIFYLSHMMKHFEDSGGGGIRTVLDIQIYLSAHPDMDRSYLAAEFEKLGMARFTAVTEALARAWFDGGDEDEQLADFGEYIAWNGVYGTLGDTALMLGGASGKTGRIRYMARRFFVPYRVMKRRYPVLVPLPFLLPFCWILRFLKALFSKHRSPLSVDFEAADALTPESVERVRRLRRYTGLE